MIDLLDILLVAHFIFNKDVPPFMWVLGVIATIGGNLRMRKITKALEKNPR